MDYVVVLQRFVSVKAGDEVISCLGLLAGAKPKAGSSSRFEKEIEIVDLSPATGAGDSEEELEDPAESFLDDGEEETCEKP